MRCAAEEEEARDRAEHAEAPLDRVQGFTCKEPDTICVTTSGTGRVLVSCADVPVGPDGAAGDRLAEPRELGVAVHVGANRVPDAVWQSRLRARSVVMTGTACMGSGILCVSVQWRLIQYWYHRPLSL